MKTAIGIDFSSVGVEAAVLSSPGPDPVSTIRIPAIACLTEDKHLLFGREASARFKRTHSSEICDRFFDRPSTVETYFGQSAGKLANEFLRYFAGELQKESGCPDARFTGVLPCSWMEAAGEVSGFWASAVNGGSFEQVALAHPGLAACALAGEMPLPSGIPFFVLDLGRYDAVLMTLLLTEGVLRVRETTMIADCGDAEMREEVFDCLVEALKTATGKIPVQSREDSQIIYDQIDRVLRELAAHGTSRVTIEGLEAVVGIEAVSKRFARFRAPILQKAKSVTQSLDTSVKSYFRVCRRAALLPGLLSELSELPNAVLEGLAEGHLAKAACLLGEGGPLAAGSNGFCEELLAERLIGYERTKPFAFVLGEKPEKMPSTSQPNKGNRPRATVYRTGNNGFIQPGEAPTHLLFQGRLLDLANETFYVGSKLENERNGIEILESMDGLLDFHFMLEPSEEQWLLVPKGETLLNREAVSAPRAVQAGDIIELPQSGLLMMVTKLVESA